jgi:hypothetical protein
VALLIKNSIKHCKINDLDPSLEAIGVEIEIDARKLKNHLSRGKKVCGIFFEISKAFDKVWHAGLIMKLIDYGVPHYLIRFVKIFLSDRSFKVNVNGHLSGAKRIECGVPQGSVLGPILFLVFINGIPLSNQLGRIPSHSVLFADDLATIFVFNKPTPEVKRKMKSYLDSLVSWLYKWRLKMNASKCCYTIFSRGGKKTDFDLKLNNDSIPKSKNPVFLGITFDEYLCFNKHFDNLRERALKRLNLIKIFSHSSWHLKKACLLSIYRSLVSSIFDYSFFAVVCVSETRMLRLQRIQNRAVRSIFKLRWDSPTAEIPILSGLLPVKERLVQLGKKYVAKNVGANFILDELLTGYARCRASLPEESTPLSIFKS